MSTCRFLYDNLITDQSMIAVSSLRTGVVTTAKKQGTGSAMLNPSGAFSGSSDLLYLLQIDSVAGGHQIGQSTFEWSEGGGAWVHTGVTTSASNILLDKGVYVNWASGGGTDFVIDDNWLFFAYSPFGPGKMLDLDRDTRYRSAALGSPNTITVTLLAEKNADALAIWDHNLTASATITLWGDDAATFNSNGGSPQLSETVPWASGNILYYLTTADRTKRYWQVRISDGTNPATYIEIGELGLFGSYFQPSKNFVRGGDYSTTFLEYAERTAAGSKRTVWYNQYDSFPLSFRAMADADRTSFDAMVTAITSRVSGIKKPFWWNEDPTVSSRTWLVDLIGGMKKTRTQNTDTLWDVGLNLETVVKTIA